MKKNILNGLGSVFAPKVRDNSGKSEMELFEQNNDLNFKTLFDSSLSAIAYGKIILDENNKPVDYVFINVNEEFEKQTGIPRSKAIGGSVRALMPGIEKSEFDWIGVHSEVAFGGKARKFEQFEKILNKWYSVYIYSPRRGYFINIFEDITVRKQLEQKLMHLLKFNRIIIESMPNILVEVNNQKKYVWANNEGLDFFGSDCIGKEAKDYFADEVDVYGFVEPLFDGTQDVVKLENWQKRRDGQKRLLSWRCVPLKNEKGVIVGALSSAQDVTEQRVAEEGLKKAEQKYEIVANNTYDWEFWIDPEGKFVYSSPSCFRLTGYSSDEFYKDKDLFTKIIHPDDREMYYDYVSAFKDGEVAEIDLRIISKYGQIVWISQIRQNITDSDGHYLGIRGSNRDINERKKMEINLSKSKEYLDNILKAVGAPLFVKDDHHRFIMVNDAFCKWLGYSKEYMEGKIDTELFPENQTKVFWSADDAVIKTGMSSMVEERISDADGDVHFVLSKKSLYVNEKGEKNIIGIITDITKRNEIELELKKRNEELEKFNQFSVERELRMVALKKEINELYKKLGQAKRYELA